MRSSLLILGIFLLICSAVVGIAGIHIVANIGATFGLIFMFVWVILITNSPRKRR